MSNYLSMHVFLKFYNQIVEKLHGIWYTKTIFFASNQSIPLGFLHANAYQKLHFVRTSGYCSGMTSYKDIILAVF